MKKFIVPYLVIFVMLVSLAVLILQLSSKISTPLESARIWSHEEQLEYANTLLGKGLEEQAALAFQDYIKESNADKKQLANVCYRLGNVYMGLYEYKKALACFYKAEALNAEADFKGAMNEKIVEALESLGMSSQAQYELEAKTAIGKPKRKQGEVIARIGKEQIAEDEINKALDRIPSWMRKQFESEQAKYNFIREYVANEVLYRKAKRLGLDKTSQVREVLEAMKKQVAVEQLLQKEIEQKLKITPQDIKLYYQANKDKYTEQIESEEGKKSKRQKSFEEVKNQVEYEYRLKKQKEITQSLLNEALEEQEVKIFYELPKEPNVKKEADVKVDGKTD